MPGLVLLLFFFLSRLSSWNQNDDGIFFLGNEFSHYSSWPDKFEDNSPECIPTFLAQRWPKIQQHHVLSFLLSLPQPVSIGLMDGRSQWPPAKGRRGDQANAGDCRIALRGCQHRLGARPFQLFLLRPSWHFSCVVHTHTISAVCLHLCYV